MEQKEIKISIPEGYEIDIEKSTFERIVFKKIDNKYPKTWKDCIEKLNALNSKEHYFEHYFAYIDAFSNIKLVNTTDKLEHENLSYDDYNLLPSEEIAEKFLILQRLYTCRQAYIGDWKPDWNIYNEPKYAIIMVENKLTISTYRNESRSFSFPTFEMAKEFLNNFETDFEKIKEIL